MQNLLYKEDVQPLTKSEFEKLSLFIYDQVGIKMSPVKKTMLETRLKKRLRETGYYSFSSYCEFLYSPKGISEELIHMIDVVTTNKTDFFREPAQFSYLSQKVLPELREKYGAGVEHSLNVWSAGCSTGEEPYTLGIVLNEFAKNIPAYRYTILASDISTKVLQAAVTGIYSIDRIEGIPLQLKKSYFLRGKESRGDTVRVVPELRKAVRFMRINFMDNDFGVREKLHIIFCRNVIIYFDKETQEILISKLLRCLHPGGYLFLGHSETIFKTDVPIEQVAPSTYRKI